MEELMTMAQLGRFLGVHTRQIFAWHSRRANNGFPEPKRREERKKGVPVPVFDANEVLEWRRHYVPKKGGANTHKKYLEKQAA
jgi:hypothetical protein